MKTVKLSRVGKKPRLRLDDLDEDSARWLRIVLEAQEYASRMERCADILSPTRLRRPRTAAMAGMWALHGLGMLCVLLWLCSTAPTAKAVPVFDCTGDDIETFPISLMEPERCQPAESFYDHPKKVRVQVIQRKTKRMVKVFQCKITESVSVTRCGFDSLTYGSVAVKRNAIVPISKEECAKAVQHSEFTYKGRKFSGVPLHQTTTEEFFTQGRVDPDGTCQTSDFVTNGMLFQKSYEVTTVKIFLAKVYGKLNTETGLINFENIRAEFTEGAMYDPTVGVLTWNTTKPLCHEASSTLYHGDGDLYQQENSTDHQGVLILENTATQQYGGFLLGEADLECGATAHATQIPGVLVKVISRGSIPIYNDNYKGETETLEASILAKTHYLHLTQEVSFEGRLSVVYNNLCNLDYNGRSTQLRLVARDNDLAVLDLFGPGHISIRAGGAAYVVKCAAVTAEVREHVNCTLDLPVTYNNASLFADPVSLILKEQSRVVPCNTALPTRIKLLETWYCLSPGLQECPPPMQITSSIERLPNARNPMIDLGADLFTPEQRAARKYFLAYVLSREPALDQLAYISLRNGRAGQATGVPLTAADKASLTDYLAASLSPGYYLLGSWYFYAFVITTLLGMVKIVLDALVQMILVIRLKGCGWWLIPALFHAFFMVIITPARFLLPDPDLLAKIPVIEEELADLRKRAAGCRHHHHAHSSGDSDDDHGGFGTRRGPKTRALAPRRRYFQPEPKGAGGTRALIYQGNHRVYAAVQPSDEDAPPHYDHVRLQQTRGYNAKITAPPASAASFPQPGPEEAAGFCTSPLLGQGLLAAANQTVVVPAELLQDVAQRLERVREGTDNHDGTLAHLATLLRRGVPGFSTDPTGGRGLPAPATGAAGTLPRRATRTPPTATVSPRGSMMPDTGLPPPPATHDPGNEPPPRAVPLDADVQHVISHTTASIPDGISHLYN